MKLCTRLLSLEPSIHKRRQGFALGVKAMLALILIMSFAQVSQAQGPCNAHRYDAGDGWRFNAAANRWEAVGISGQTQPQGIVSCGNSAETENNLQAYQGNYDPSLFTVSVPGDCNFPSPSAGQKMIWFNFDIRPLAGTFQFQLESSGGAGQGVRWAVYYADDAHSGPPGGTFPNEASYPSATTGGSGPGNGLSGNCANQTLTYADCGTSFTGWETLTVPSFTKPTNYYLAIWADNGQEIVTNVIFKSRYGCGGSTCALQKSGADQLTCNPDGTYTVCATFDGSAGKWALQDNASVKASSYSVTTYDQFGAQVSTATSANIADLILELGTTDGANSQNDVKAVICATYPLGSPYAISLTPSGTPAGAPGDYVACTTSGSFSGNGLAQVTAPTASATSPACGQTNGSITITNYDASVTYTL
ncbi:MAG: hypothetical protein EOO14_18385, partial [Chitinophagaceae bacterium]